MCLGVFCLGFILFGTFWVSWTWVAISLHILGKFSTIISPSIFSWPFCLLLLGLLWFECWSIWHCPRGPWGCPHFFSFFFLFSSLLHLFLPFYLLPHLSYLLPLLFYCWFPSGVFFISFIALFIIDWLFFISSRSLLNISCIFSILYSRLFVCNSILFSRFWIIFLSLFWTLFQVDFLSPPLWFGLVGIYHVPLPAKYFSAFSSCLDCCVWGGFSVFWQFVVPLYCGGSSLWVALDE